MPAQIGFIHRRGRMIAHGWMPVESEAFAFSSRSQPGEEVPEDTVPTEHGHTSDDGNEGRLEDGHPDIDGFSDAADMRCRIKCGADLVMDMSGAAVVQCPESRQQRGFHGLRRHGPRHACYAKGIQAGICSQGIRSRRFGEQHGACPCEGYSLKRVGTAGEIITVESESDAGGFHIYIYLTSNFRLAAANAG